MSSSPIPQRVSDIERQFVRKAPLRKDAVEGGLTAGGTSQGDATPITRSITELLGTGTARLPDAAAGFTVWVSNGSGSNVTVYPSSGDLMNGVTDAGTTITTKATTVFACPKEGEWYSK